MIRCNCYVNYTVTDPPHVLPYDQSPSSVGVSNNNNNSQPSAPQLIPRPPSYVSVNNSKTMFTNAKIHC